MITLKIEMIDQEKLVTDFSYFLEIYNQVDSGSKIPDELRKKYFEGFHRFSSRLPVMNQAIPDWDPAVKAPSPGIRGIIEKFASLFA